MKCVSNNHYEGDNWPVVVQVIITRLVNKNKKKKKREIMKI